MSYDYWDANTGEGLSDYELHERYDDMLGEVIGDVSVGTLSYPASRVLKMVDPIAYNVGFNEWVDSEIGQSITEEDPFVEDEA